MANPHKGEVSFEANGATYTLRLSIDAICALEDKLGRGVLDIANEMQSWAPPTKQGPDGKLVMADETKEELLARVSRVRMTLVRATFWAALRDHHPSIDLRGAGDLMVEIGGLQKTVDLVSQALVLAFPSSEAAEDNGAARPLPPSPPAAGIGSGFSTGGSQQDATKPFFGG